MSDTNKSYRIRTDIGEQSNGYLTIDTSLVQDYDTFDVLSVKISSKDTYKLHNANYGVVIGRVLANNGFGIPNAKISIFIDADSADSDFVKDIYSFSSPASEDSDGIRYNLLPDEKVSDCHQIVGTFPNKRYMLDNDVLVEIFDKYYKYTTRTNNSGDYIIVGVPTGQQTIHMDLDLSDCGILSQRPRDFVYKGYTIEQFETPNMFKTGTTYSNLSQIFSQDQVINVQPFWGNESLGETIGITRADINVAFKFEPTCVFIGSVASDSVSQGISKKCIPTDHMGDMDELTTGEGKIEMIRKTIDGDVEEFRIKGTQLINENGIWCYQIPMNLDYMVTDEYGNMVPTDDPDKGIPTRTRVRFRISMLDNEKNTDNNFRAKVLVPHNPQILDGDAYEDYDYEFGTLTKEESYRDLFWNNVYSVKSYIPRFQKSRVHGWNEKKFSGIKHCNYYGANNPIPYNNIRIRLPFLFIVMCLIIKIFIKIVGVFNYIIDYTGHGLAEIGNTPIPGLGHPLKNIFTTAQQFKLLTLDQGLCPDLENWYFAPSAGRKFKTASLGHKEYNILKQTITHLISDDTDEDVTSIDDSNADTEDETLCLTTKTDYLMSCIEMNLAQEYRVINFDFYNDWINGLVYFPRWNRYVRKKKKFLGITIARAKVMSCMDNVKTFSKVRKYTQQCSMPYNVTKGMFTKVREDKNMKMHKKKGFLQVSIFGKNGGICHEQYNMNKQYIYYLKPCEWQQGSTPNNKKVTLFATDIILLGSLNTCDVYGIPQAFKYLSSTSYIMPTNLALTNMDTNGPLYATGNGTICAGKVSQTASLSGKDVIHDLGIKEVNVSEGGLKSEIVYYNGGGKDTTYAYSASGENGDTIALTEAAGIAWNWTGPGQGTADDNKLYNPGGHFLGMSCLNSQSNMKSCINLSRICEIGASMSQRKEDPRVMTTDGTLKYTYTVPSGFISGNEIIDEDFRSMFATMNHNRLIATKTIEGSGYKTYDFDFLRPTGFDGRFKTVADKHNDVYNKLISVKEENLTSYGINAGINRADFDSEETGNTQVRTIEDYSIDYYLFRMGLDYDDLGQNSVKQRRKFLGSNGNTLYLPQYENSYYFYFGMKYGATALDEFNKQFFSECDTTKLINKLSTFDLSVSSYDIYEGTAKVQLVMNNLSTPFEYIQYYAEGDEDNIHYLSGETLSMTTISLDMDFGTYTFSLKDADGIEITKTIKVGTDLVSSTYEKFDFTVPDETTIHEVSSDERIFDGGYIEISNIVINLSGETIDSGSVVVELIDASGTVEYSVDAELGLLDEEYHIYAKHAGIVYTLAVRREVEGHTALFPIAYVTFNNTSSTTLRLGVNSDNGWNIPFYTGTTVVSNVDGDKTLQLSSNNMSSDWWTSFLFDSPTNKSAWLYKEALFCPTNNGSGDTHNELVYADGGAKIVFGSPQSETNILSDRTIYNIEDQTDVPDGYILDDEYVMYSTYGDRWKEIISTNPGESAIFHFAAQAYNDFVISGKYIATFSASSAEITDTRICREGYPCIVRYLNDNNIEYVNVKDGKVSSDNMLNGYGVVYPTFIYPSIYRPFYADINFFRWQDKSLTYTYDETEGSQYPMAVSEEYGCKVEGKIYNGITYGETLSFADSSYVGGYYDDDSDTLINISDFNVKGNDISGLTVTGATNRITEVSGYTSREATDIEHSYQITDGSPEEASAFTDTIVHNINDEITCTFYDDILYTQDGNKIKFIPTGSATINSSVNYYFCNQRTFGLNFVSSNKYLRLLNATQDGYYVLCIFTMDSEYTTAGTTTYVSLRFNNNNVTYTYKANGTIFTDSYYISGSTSDPIETKCDRAVTVLEKNTNAVTPCRYGTINSTSVSWEDSISICCQHFDDAYLISSDDFNTYKDMTGIYDPSQSGSDIFVIAKYEQQCDNAPLGTTKLYKIYPALTKVLVYNELAPYTDRDNEYNIEVYNLNPASGAATAITQVIITGSGVSSKDVFIYAGKNVDYVVNYTGGTSEIEWVQGIHKHGEASEYNPGYIYATVIVLNELPTGTDSRYCDVTFYYYHGAGQQDIKASTSKTLRIIQSRS